MSRALQTAMPVPAQARPPYGKAPWTTAHLPLQTDRHDVAATDTTAAWLSGALDPVTAPRWRAEPLRGGRG